jgi:hypothetical protein
MNGWEMLVAFGLWISGLMAFLNGYGIVGCIFVVFGLIHGWFMNKKYP